jgi:hypothetical protein
MVSHSCCLTLTVQLDQCLGGGSSITRSSLPRWWWRREITVSVSANALSLASDMPPVCLFSWRPLRLAVSINLVGVRWTQHCSCGWLMSYLGYRESSRFLWSSIVTKAANDGTQRIC